MFWFRHDLSLSFLILPNMKWMWLNSNNLISSVAASLIRTFFLVLSLRAAGQSCPHRCPGILATWLWYQTSSVIAPNSLQVAVLWPAVAHDTRLWSVGYLSYIVQNTFANSNYCTLYYTELACPPQELMAMKINVLIFICWVHVVIKLKLLRWSSTTMASWSWTCD